VLCNVNPFPLYVRSPPRNMEANLMKKLITLTAATLMLGAMAISASAQMQHKGANGLNTLKNATPIVRLAACNGWTGGCGCGPGWISACGNRCCRCVPCY
jgi:hypothetical protein